MSDSPLPNDEKLNPLNPQKSGDSPQATPHRRHRSRAGILLPQLRQCLNDLRAMDDREWALRLERIDHDQTPSATSTPDTYVLRKAGAMWEILYHGERLWIKDTKGVPYLSYLLRYPHHDFPILELVQLVERGKLTESTPYQHMSKEVLAQESLYVSPGDTGELLDAKAKIIGKYLRVFQ